MSNIVAPWDARNTWLIVLPISGLQFGAGGGSEVRIDRATFLTRDRLLRIASRLRVRQHILQIHKFMDSPAFQHTYAFATMWHSETGTVAAEVSRSIIGEELMILAASKLGACRALSDSPLSIGLAASGPLEMLVLATNGNHSFNHSRNRGIQPLLLDRHWRDNVTDGFFDRLLRIIRGSTRVDRAWRIALRRVAILAGMSRNTHDLPSAFLYNAIALEILLTRQSDKVRDAMPGRLAALFGWMDYWKTEDYQAKVLSLYEKRCRLVHEGNSDGLTKDDLIVSDSLVHNLLANIARLPRRFSSKDRIVEWQQYREAKELLSQIGRRPNIRGFRYYQLGYGTVTKDLM